MDRAVATASCNVRSRKGGGSDSDSVNGGGVCARSSQVCAVGVGVLDGRGELLEMPQVRRPEIHLRPVADRTANVQRCRSQKEDQVATKSPLHSISVRRD